MNLRTTLAMLTISFITGFLACYFLVKKEARQIEIPDARQVFMSSVGLRLPEFNPKPIYPFQTIRFVPAGRDTVYRVDTVRVPVYYPAGYWLTRPDPISQRGNTLSFRYYDPEDGMEKVNRYEVKPKGLQWAVYADLFQPLDQLFGPVRDMEPTLGARFNLSWRSVGLHVGTYVTPSLNDVRAVAGVSVKLAGNY